MYKNVEDLLKKRKRLQIESYKQTTNYTCVAASYLIFLSYALPELFKKNKETEMDLHNKIKFWEGGEGEYGSYPKLARHALSLGLEVKLGLNAVPKQPEFIDDETWKGYMDNYLPIIDELKEDGSFLFEKKDFNSIDLINQVEQGYVPIVEIKYPSDDCTHHVIVRGFDGRKIKIVDPEIGYSSYELERFDDLINISYMKNYLSLRRPKNLLVDLVAEGIPASQGNSIGFAYVTDRYTDKFIQDSILVSPRTDPDMIPNMFSSIGVVTDQGGALCHAAIVSREIGIPAVVGSRTATKKIKSGDRIFLDGSSGKVYSILKNE